MGVPGVLTVLADLTVPGRALVLVTGWRRGSSPGSGSGLDGAAVPAVASADLSSPALAATVSAGSSGGGVEVPARLVRFASAAAERGREGGQAVDGGRGRAAGTGRAAPTLAELDALVGQSRAAGMAVELSVEGTPAGDCPPPVEQTAYRVVQEALTNVHKHAAGASTRVRVAHREAEVALQVENEPAADGAADAGLPSGGNGLVGMRERVTALGGGFVSGPTDAGGSGFPRSFRTRVGNARGQVLNLGSPTCP